MAEGAGFEPAEGCEPSRDFKSPAFVRSATPPAEGLNYSPHFLRKRYSSPFPNSFPFRINR